MSSGFSILTGTLDKSQWVLQISALIDQNLLPAISQTPISVFHLPESVRAADPEAYIPRRLAVGPYHHFRPELYSMDLFKLGKVQNLKWGPQIQLLADQLKPLELKIRACFDQSLEIDGETLSWVVLVDGLFLLDLLQTEFSNRPLKFPLEIYFGKIWSEFEIVSDLLKLENQIPFFILEEICPKEPISYLTSLVYQFSSSVSPFEFPYFNPDLECFGFSPDLPEIFNLSSHLLHFVYYLILLIPDEIAVVNICAYSTRIGMDSPSSSSVEFFSECLNILGSVINIAFIQQAKETLGLILRLFRLMGSITNSKPNLSEKKALLIPSASDLKTSGIIFKSSKNGVLKCRFDETTHTLTLPSIHLDGFSQVLFKNLVAFEAMAELNPPCLIDYIAVMNGLLRNSQDLMILEKAGIVRNHLSSEEQAVELFNGVESSSSSLKKESILNFHIKNYIETEIGFIQEVKMNYEMGLGVMVVEINKWYESCWRMKMKKFVSFVLKCLAIIFIVFVIVLVIARFVCNFVSCPVGMFKTSSIDLHQMY